MKAVALSLVCVASSWLIGQTPITQKSSSSPSGPLPVSISVYDRTRFDASQWFAAPPEVETYGYVESLIRLGVAQRVHHFDWQLELSQPALLSLPAHAISPNAAQGQLGLGATYYASNGNNDYPAAAFLKQGFLRYHFRGSDNSIRLGRFEFIEGLETQPKDRTLAWLQGNRIAHRLIGNFGFSNAQRSFDGLDAHVGGGSWDVTGMAARADQGVYNMNGNPELNVDIQYLGLTRYELKKHLLWRAFGIGYHDGRTGVLKTDNRPLPIRQTDHGNIRIASYGADVITVLPIGPGKFDLVGWGVLQNGNWGVQNHRAAAFAVEGGYQFTSLKTAPWIRGGIFRGTGDNNPSDSQHNTFFQLLPTPRIYARFPFYDLMNNEDEFVQILDRVSKHVDLRADVHWLQLTSNKDLWYLGGGAFDNKVFGFVGRPAAGDSSFASLADASADCQITSDFSLSAYYAHAWGKTVIGAIYPSNRTAQFGYLEIVYHWELPQKAGK